MDAQEANIDKSWIFHGPRLVLASRLELAIREHLWSGGHAVSRPFNRIER